VDCAFATNNPDTTPTLWSEVLITLLDVNRALEETKKHAHFMRKEEQELQLRVLDLIHRVRDQVPTVEVDAEIQ
jgi:hypothetical protein